MLSKSDIEEMCENLTFRSTQSSPYGEVIDHVTKRVKAILAPCYSVGRKGGIALLKTKTTGQLTLVSVMVDTAFRNDTEEGVNPVKIMMDKALSGHECICAGLGGGRFSFHKDGYHMFGIETYPIARIWVNHVPEGHMPVTLHGTTYGIQPVSYAKWVRETSDVSYQEIDSYQSLCIGVLPELHSRRTSYRQRVEEELRQQQGN